MAPKDFQKAEVGQLKASAKETAEIIGIGKTCFCL